MDLSKTFQVSINAFECFLIDVIMISFIRIVGFISIIISLTHREERLFSTIIFVIFDRVSSFFNDVNSFAMLGLLFEVEIEPVILLGNSNNYILLYTHEYS